MLDEQIDISTATKSFKPIRDYLEGGWEHREVSIGVLATAIEDEKIGIYTWDRFGRFVKANEAEEESILSLLAKIYEHENDTYGRQHPLDEASTLPDDPFSLFGWRTDKKPDFEKLTMQHSMEDITRPKPQEKAAITKKQNTSLLIIGALCAKLQISLLERGGAAKIQKFVEEIGCTLDVETIRNVLKRVESVVEIKAK